MKKTLIVLAHPDFKRSVANKKLKEEAEKNPDVIIHNIYEKYADGKIDVVKELELLKETGNLILQFPMQWFGCPSLLKEWIDVVFMTAHYAENQERVLADKRIGVAVTTGGVKEKYDGSNGTTIDDVLVPFKLSANHLNAINLPVFSVHGVMPGLITGEEISKKAKEYAEYLKNNM